MRTSKMRAATILALGLLLIALPLLGACGEKEVVKEVIKEVPVEKEVVREVIKEVPVEKEVVKEVIREVEKVKKVVKFGATPDLTGPYSTIIAPIYRGGMDYFRYVNEKESIPGIKVEVSWVDQRSDPSVIMSAYRKMEAEGVKGVWLFTSVDATVLQARLNEDKIPGGGTASASSLLDPPGYTYTTYVNGAQAMLTGAEWYLSEFKKKGLNRPMKIAILGWDNPYGREGLEPLIPWAEANSDVELDGDVWVSLRAMDYTASLLSLREKNPDVVFSICNGGIALRDAGKVGLPEDVPFIFCTGSVDDPGYVKLAGDQISRAYSVSTLWTASEDKPIIDLAKELYVKYHDEIPHEVPMGWLGGWQSAAILYEGLRIALDKVGYENLTGEAVAEGIFSIKDWDGAMTGATISFADYEGDRLGQEDYRVWSYDTDDQWWVPASDWIKAPAFSEVMTKYAK